MRLRQEAGLLEKIGGVKVSDIYNFLVHFLTEFAAEAIDGSFAGFEAAAGKFGHSHPKPEFVGKQDFCFIPHDETVNADGDFVDRVHEKFFGKKLRRDDEFPRIFKKAVFADVDEIKPRLEIVFIQSGRSFTYYRNFTNQPAPTVENADKVFFVWFLGKPDDRIC